MKAMVRDDERDWLIDSCATSCEEIGNDIYPPAKRCLTAHGVPFTRHSARQITRQDYDSFDRIICMERYNIRNLHYVLGNDIMTRDASRPEPKIRLLFSNPVAERDVADPWYTGDFETTYNDLVEGITQLIESFAYTDFETFCS